MLNSYRYRGRHRVPSTTRRNLARAVLVATVSVGPLAVAELPAQADTLDEIAACESGGNPTAQNAVSSASGLYQMIDGTWHAYGGSTAHARQASVAEQTAVARRLLAAEGTSPWDASRSCWFEKVTRGSAAPMRFAQGAAGGSYVVVPGDTLSSIAERQGDQWQALWERNRAVVEDPGLIFPGERLALQ